MKATDFFSDQAALALAEASVRGQTEAIAKMVAAGTDANARGKDGMTPLQWAIIKGSKTGFRALLERGANPNLQTKDGDSAMLLAAIAEDSEFLRLALEHGGNPNLVDPSTARTPIYESITHLRLDNITTLMDSGADLNFRDRTGSTPVMRAASTLRYDLVYRMLKAGADPTVKNRWGNTLTFFLKLNNVDPKHELYQWRAKVIELLQAKGIEIK
jgi:ankyrin repeat protein